MDRVIMHVDIDAFFASVEQLDNPELKGKPVIVGGVGERGVVATASYEARKYGVHSAMPAFKARQICPMGIFVPTRHERYREVSNEVFKMLYSLTAIIEPLSIDEAYMDITKVNMEPLECAKFIKRNIKEKVGLTVSAGVSYNKFLAKLASDWNKPDGITIITEDMIPDILKPLPVSKVHGMGKKSVEKMNNIGIFTIEDMYNLSKEFCIEYFGKFGVEIYDRIRGIDTREVEVLRERKSIGRETTLKKDLSNKEDMKKYLEYFSEEVSETLKNKNIWGKTITVKIKTSKFANHTKGKTINYYTNNKDEIYKIAYEILRDMEIEDSIRLIGLTVSTLTENKVEQLTFF
ncbi:DNA polymerase IV [Clostridium sp. MSJ-11]|uniref:DNA polymerase IV n=1 Tax=Clostridium mobile TaxID=2841512 RepID=A0ABS6EKU3_9CLOT|nr:DNA polymerase IV [Clostridium mobile]MBU5485823.1 DNA polymerase IV [Clostridium mobile]